MKYKVGQIVKVKSFSDFRKDPDIEFWAWGENKLSKETKRGEVVFISSLHQSSLDPVKSYRIISSMFNFLGNYYIIKSIDTETSPFLQYYYTLEKIKIKEEISFKWQDWMIENPFKRMLNFFEKVEK